MGRCKHGQLPQRQSAAQNQRAAAAMAALFLRCVFQLVPKTRHCRRCAAPRVFSSTSRRLGLRLPREVRSAWLALTITASGSTRLGGPAVACGLTGRELPPLSLCLCVCVSRSKAKKVGHKESSASPGSSPRNRPNVDKRLPLQPVLPNLRLYFIFVFDIGFSSNHYINHYIVRD